jgi:Family of unknown function (DUF6406)
VSERIQIAETGQILHNGHRVTASSIWERHAIGEPGTPVLLRARVGVDGGLADEVVVGDTVAIGDETWRVEEIVEDPDHGRGSVLLRRVD